MVGTGGSEFSVDAALVSGRGRAVFSGYGRSGRVGVSGADGDARTGASHAIWGLAEFGSGAVHLHGIEPRWKRLCYRGPRRRGCVRNRFAIALRQVSQNTYQLLK